MTKIPSASTSQPPRSTSEEVVIEMPPLQGRNQTPPPVTDPALSGLASKPSGRRGNSDHRKGSGSSTDRNQHTGESPLLHASGASMLHGNESTSERFFDAIDSFESFDPPSIPHQHAAPRDPQVHTSATTTPTTRTERVGALAASIRSGATHGVRVVLGPTATAVMAAARGALPISVDKQYLGAVLGHMVHQSTSVGPTTFARELLGEGLFAALRQLPPEAVVAMQAVSGTLQMALHTLRRNREKRNLDAAARGFHNLSHEQWDALSEDERDDKKAEQQRYSDLVTRLALGGILSNIAVGAAGKASGEPEMAARLLASDLKIAAYAAARDTIQATFSMVGMRGPTNGGVSDPHITSAGRFYGMANVLTNLASNELASPNFAAARERWAGLNSPFTKGEATSVIFRQSAVTTALNVSLETMDWINVTQHEADEAGTMQIWEPAWKGKREDYERVLDHSVARTAAINSNIALGTAINMIGAWVGLSPARSALLANTMSGVVAGMQYKTIGATWQADAAVRGAEASRVQAG
ncbi:hypothetical protein [Xanthomonas arboricola]|uniref:hypothetical protein n=1 Tax=Xanthomonas arboricola TaxID=56448 RepID=UPI001EE6BD62|nr:hypothetical protein [Xanthomonas arboricola]